MIPLFLCVTNRRATSSELPMAMRFRHLEKTSKEAVGVYRWCQQHAYKTRAWVFLKHILYAQSRLFCFYILVDPTFTAAACSAKGTLRLERWWSSTPATSFALSWLISARNTMTAKLVHIIYTTLVKIMCVQSCQALSEVVSQYCNSIKCHFNS